jgi:hypothetical protein
MTNFQEFIDSALKEYDIEDVNTNKRPIIFFRDHLVYFLNVAHGIPLENVMLMLRLIVSKQALRTSTRLRRYDSKILERLQEISDKHTTVKFDVKFTGKSERIQGLTNSITYIDDPNDIAKTIEEIIACQKIEHIFITIDNTIPSKPKYVVSVYRYL